MQQRGPRGVLRMFKRHTDRRRLQACASPLRGRLQPRPPSPVTQLPHSSRVPSELGLRETAGGVSDLADQYSGWKDEFHRANISAILVVRACVEEEELEHGWPV